jgi:L-rhamnose mutarotase
VLHVRPDRTDEYRQRHPYVWPEMLEVLATTTLAQPLAIDVDDALLVGQVDADDLQAWQAAMARTEVNAGWRAGIAAFFVGLEGWAPDEGIALLEKNFNLEEQSAEPDDDGSHPDGSTP